MKTIPAFPFFVKDGRENIYYCIAYEFQYVAIEITNEITTIFEYKSSSNNTNIYRKYYDDHAGRYLLISKEEFSHVYETSVNVLRDIINQPTDLPGKNKGPKTPGE